MKHVLTTLTGLTALLLALLLVPAAMSAQKGKIPRTTELYADFRDAAGDKIHSNHTDPFYSNDDTPGYPNSVYLSESGTLAMRIQQTQRVFFDFNTPLRTWVDESGRVMCRAYSPDGTGTIFYATPPEFLSTGGRPDNHFTQIVTGGGYVENNGVWSFSSTYVNLKALGAGEIAYVLLSIRFDIPDESLFMHFGSRIWALDYAKPANGWAGIVQVTRTSGQSWYIEPLPIDHRIATERGLQADQTALFMQGSTGKGAKGLSGNCDLGDWQMPFALSLWVR
jgi:hypothetical protein